MTAFTLQFLTLLLDYNCFSNLLLKWLLSLFLTYLTLHNLKSVIILLPDFYYPRFFCALSLFSLCLSISVSLSPFTSIVTRFCYHFSSFSLWTLLSFTYWIVSTASSGQLLLFTSCMFSQISLCHSQLDTALWMASRWAQYPVSKRQFHIYLYKHIISSGECLDYKHTSSPSREKCTSTWLVSFNF